MGVWLHIKEKKSTIWVIMASIASVSAVASSPAGKVISSLCKTVDMSFVK